MRASNLLRRHGIQSLDEVAALRPDELRDMRGSGPALIAEIAGALSANGFQVDPDRLEMCTSPPRSGRSGLRRADEESERNQTMVRLRQEGRTLQEIASQFSVSRERVRQIVSARGELAPHARAARRARQQSEADSSRAEIIAAYRSGGELADVARDLSLPTAVVEDIIKDTATQADRAERRRQRASASRASIPTYSEKDLVAAIQTVAERMGGVPSSGDYRRVAAEMGLPSLPTIIARLGWANAVRAAGMTPLPTPRREYRRRWGEAQCWAALRRLTAELGHPPTAQQYDVLAGLDEELPSLATVRNRLGRWSDVVHRLVAAPHEHDVLRRLGVSADADQEQRQQEIWLAHLAGEVSDHELDGLIAEGLFEWQPSYGPRPEG